VPQKIIKSIGIFYAHDVLLNEEFYLQKARDYLPGPILPLPEVEKKLDFSPSLVDIYRPIRKIAGTPINRRLATKPKFVVSMTKDGYHENVSPTGPLKHNPGRPCHRA